MGILNYSGNLPIAVVLSWKGEKAAGAGTDAFDAMEYVIANESMTAFSINAAWSGNAFSIKRQAKPGKRLFDDALNTYVCDDVPAAQLEELLSGAVTPSCSFEATFSYCPFFDLFLKQIASSSSDSHNFANPADQTELLKTFVRVADKNGIRITYHYETKSISGIPCKLVDKQVTSAGPGKPPAVKAVFELDFLSPVDPAKREIMRKLIAMDWSKLVRYGKKGSAAVMVSVWWYNVLAYIANNADVERGKRLHEEIVARHAAKTPQALSIDLRNDLDAYLITANHWGELRENIVSEKYQRFVSDLFGCVQQSAWLASPVNFIRNLESFMNDEDIPALILQIGAGHCGEHARVSFSILKAIIAKPGSQVPYAVRTGNANIDHAFVVYNLQVDTVIRTLATNPKNTSVSVGEEIFVWNLREAIAKNPSRIGYVMDPYLDQTIMKPSAKELLAAINTAKRKAEGLDTDFLSFGAKFPPGCTVQDIRTKSEADRKSSVKNV
jgi:hypothetical protein